MLKPKARFNKITDITPNFLKENNIKAVILDVDNTLIDLSKNPLENIEEWIQELKDNNIRICIASNSMKKNKIITIASKLDIPYVYGSMKPFSRGLKKAISNLQSEYMKYKPEQIAEIGDQLFTDVLGANRLRIIFYFNKSDFA